MRFFLILLSLGFISGANAGECDFIQFNACQSCDNPLAFSVGSDEACSYLCPNREVNYENSGTQVIIRNCALKKCPDNFPFQAVNGSCFATKSDAEYYEEELIEENTNNDNIYVSSSTFVKNGKCPENKPIMTKETCHSCEELDDWDVSEEKCAKCPNRVFKFYSKWDVAQCEPKSHKDKPLRRWDGTFFSCDESKTIRIETHCNFDKDCEDVCPNRTVLYRIGGNIPSVPNCPPDKPLMDREGICYSCDVPISVGLEWNERLCQRFCPTKRHLWGMECVLND